MPDVCEPAAIFAIVLSDIVGDPLDMIASGPAYADSSTASDAIAIVEKYHLKLSGKARTLLEMKTPKAVTNVETRITGSVRNLCLAAKEACEKLGYESMILTDALQCEAKEAGAFLAAIAKTHQNTDKSLAFIAGGETIVHVTGKDSADATRSWHLRRQKDWLHAEILPFSASEATEATDRPMQPVAIAMKYKRKTAAGRT